MVVFASMLALVAASAEPTNFEAPATIEINFDPAFNVLVAPTSALAIRLKRAAFADLVDWAAKSADHAEGFAFEFRRHCTLHHHGGGVRSALCTTRSFRGGASGETLYSAVLWDVSHDHEIGLASLIETAGLPALAQALSGAALRAVSGDAAALADPEALARRPFVLEPGAIVFLFHTREIAPAVYGAPRIAVPAASYASHLTPLGRRALGLDHTGQSSLPKKR